ncbi:MAG TPA: site-specific integrase [Bacillota bacterium]|nr:site-specific integrase [Bacillota bacterium]
MKAEQAKTKIRPRKDMRIGELWEEYLVYIEAEQGAQSTVLHHAKSFEGNHILPKCKHKKLSQMSTLDWQEIINTAKPVKRKYKTKTITLTQTESGKLSEKTLKNLRGVIGGFMKWCRRGDLTTLNPELIIPRGREKVAKDVLTTEEANALVRTRISNNPMLHAFRLQIALGLRSGEVLALKMSDIDGKMMHIQRSLNDKGKITGGKNFKANRQEYLFPLAYEIVQDQIKYRKQQKIASDRGWLFPQADGSITSHAIYRRKLTGYCNDVGCTPIAHIASGTVLSLL